MATFWGGGGGGGGRTLRNNRGRGGGPILCNKGREVEKGGKKGEKGNIPVFRPRERKKRPYCLPGNQERREKGEKKVALPE